MIFALSQKENKPKKEKFSKYNQQERYDRKQNNPSKNEKDDNTNEEPNQDFIRKGYSDRDIKELKNWGLGASDIPDLKKPRRRGVINTLAFNGSGKGSCSELVIILKKSPFVSAEKFSKDSLDSMKINQSQEFADTRNNNDAVVRFAVDKILESGGKWEYDVYILKANSKAGTISGPSAGSGVYMALLSAFYSDCTVPSNLAVTGELETEKKEIPTQIKPLTKKYQWQANRCAECNKRSDLYHFIYNKDLHKIEKSFISNAVSPDSELVFCTKNHFQEWWDKNVYTCWECGEQRIGSCSCCGKNHSWIREGSKNEKFCSEECINKHYPKTYKEGEIIAIGGLNEKVSAAVKKGCDTIIIPKSNSADYLNEVPLSVQAKVKKLYEVENHKDLRGLFLSGL